MDIQELVKNIKKIYRYEKKKGEDWINREYESFQTDQTTEKAKKAACNRRRRDDRSMRMPKYFNKEYNEEEFRKHGKHYKLLSMYLVDKPNRTAKIKKEMYEGKKKRIGASPQTREYIRTCGKPKIKKDVIEVNDLPETIINSSIGELGAETETEEERMEKNLALLLERAKEEKTASQGREIPSLKTLIIHLQSHRNSTQHLRCSYL
jgi:hypothetical protein